MNEAPERIWVDDECHYEARNPHRTHSVEYIRADIVSSQIAEMSECFRAVNIAKVIRQSGNDFVLQAERMMKMQAELATVKLAAEANHNLAVANGNRAREEYDRAENAKIEFDRAMDAIKIIVDKYAILSEQACETFKNGIPLALFKQHMGELQRRIDLHIYRR